MSRWRGAVASGDPAAIRQLASPDFQLQRPDGSGVSLDDYVSGTLESSRQAAIVDLVATSFSNTMITRCQLRLDDKVSPRLTVFQRIDGEWRAAADAEYPAIE